MKKDNENTDKRYQAEREYLAKLFYSANGLEEMQQIIGEVFSRKEIARAQKRVSAALLVINGYTYREILAEMGGSSYLINRAKETIVYSATGRVAAFLKQQGEDGREIKA